MCARTMPAAATANQPQETSAPRYTAKRPAIAAATRVIGSTPARVKYSHFDTGSIGPGGGFVVASTYRQLRKRPPRAGLFADCAAEVSAMTPKPRRRDESTLRPVTLGRFAAMTAAKGGGGGDDDDDCVRPGAGAAPLTEQRRGSPLHRRRR